MNIFFSLALVLSVTPVIKPAPIVSIPSHDAFFDAISKHCGKAYEGIIAQNTPPSDDFEGVKLLMHVRVCDENRLEIPFFVGDNASRTWIIKKTGSGLSLKHDHRLENGDYDPVTMYGGHTQDAGTKHIQSFPADAYSKLMFSEKGLPQSLGNTWQVYVYDEVFSYRLIRQGREFRVDFDLTQPVDAPPAPWGYE